MDKNIAALLREDARTVRVVFDTPSPDKGSVNLYTYVTDLSLAVGDVVLVDARGKLTVAYVYEVDDTVNIAPNDAVAYKWVQARVDLAAYAATAARNAEIEAAVVAAYKQNLRRSFASQVLAGVDEGTALRLTTLIGGARG